MSHSSEKRIRSVLKNYRTRLAAEFMRTGLLVSILAGILFLGGSITAESLWYLAPGTKTALLWITGAIVAFGVFSSGAWVGFIGAGGAAAYSGAALARRLGKKYPEISDKIFNALSLLNKRDEYGYSESLTELNLQQVAEIADQVDPKEAVSNANRKRVQKLIAVSQDSGCSSGFLSQLESLAAWHACFSRIQNFRNHCRLHSRFHLAMYRCSLKIRLR